MNMGMRKSESQARPPPKMERFGLLDRHIPGAILRLIHADETLDSHVIHVRNGVDQEEGADATIECLC
jgi:hypothetical protein